MTHSHPRVLVIQHLSHDHLHELAGPLVEAGFDFTTWCTFAEPEPPLGADDVDAIISMGGDDSAYDEANVPWIATERELLRSALQRRIPILGVCFGAQILAIAAGGRGFRAENHEIGWTRVDYLDTAEEDRMGRILVRSPDVFQFHYDTFALPDGAVLLGQTDGMVQAYRIGDRAWGVQFHIEADPGLIYAWLGMYADELQDKGADADAIAADTTNYWSTYRDVAWALATEFADVVAGD